MNFDEALQVELETITGFAKKIYPVLAPKSGEAPFLVFKTENIDFRKTLGGNSNKAEAIYSITLVSRDYPELKGLTFETINKLLSFLGRNIGDVADIGPYVENVTVKHMGDTYITELDNFRADLQLKVNY